MSVVSVCVCVCIVCCECVFLCAAMGEPGVLYRGSGQGVTMDCGEADPNQGFEWRGLERSECLLVKGNTAAAQKIKLSGASLMIPAVDISDSGVYTCSELDVKKSKKAQHTLHVVSVSVSPSDTVLFHTDVTLRCDVPGDPAAQVQWMKSPGDEPYGSPSNTVTLTSVTSAEAGQWACQIRDKAGTEVGRFGVDIKVVGPLISPGKVVAPSGGAAELPCFLPTPSCLGIDGGGWARIGSTDLQFPVLVREARGLRWSGTKPRVAFRDEPLSTNFTVRVENVQPSDAGQYVCTLVFQGGQSLNATLSLKVTTGEEHLAPSKPSPSSPGHLEITAPLGGTAELPCTHPNSSSLRIVRGGWAHVPSTEVRFPVLLSTEAKGLRWNGTGSLNAKVSFSDQQLSTNFNIKLNNVTHADAGTYVCTLVFADGGNWDAKLTLRVGGETVGVASGPPTKRTPVDPFPPQHLSPGPSDPIRQGILLTPAGRAYSLPQQAGRTPYPSRQGVLFTPAGRAYSLPQQAGPTPYPSRQGLLLTPAGRAYSLPQQAGRTPYPSRQGVLFTPAGRPYSLPQQAGPTPYPSRQGLLLTPAGRPYSLPQQAGRTPYPSRQGVLLTPAGRAYSLPQQAGRTPYPSRQGVLLTPAGRAYSLPQQGGRTPYPSRQGVLLTPAGRAYSLPQQAGRTPYPSRQGVLLTPAGRAYSLHQQAGRTPYPSRQGVPLTPAGRAYSLPQPAGRTPYPSRQGVLLTPAGRAYPLPQQAGRTPYPSRQGVLLTPAGRAYSLPQQAGRTPYPSRQGGVCVMLGCALGVCVMLGSAQGVCVMLGSALGVCMMLGCALGVCVMLGSGLGVCVMLGCALGVCVMLGSGLGVCVMLGCALGVCVMLGCAQGVCVMLGCALGVCVMLGSALGVCMMLGCAQGVCVMLGCALGVCVMLGCALGVCVMLGSALGVCVMLGSALGVCVMLGSALGVCVMLGCALGVCVMLGSALGVCVMLGCAQGVCVMLGCALGVCVMLGCALGVCVMLGCAQGVCVMLGCALGVCVMLGCALGVCVMLGCAQGVCVMLGCALGVCVMLGCALGVCVMLGCALGVCVMLGSALGVRPSWIDGEFWKKPVLLGLALWIWVAIAAGSLLLIVLVIVITSVRCRRKKRGRKGEKSEVKTEMYYAQESVPMQDEVVLRGAAVCRWCCTNRMTHGGHHCSLEVCNGGVESLCECRMSPRRFLLLMLPGTAWPSPTPPPAGPAFKGCNQHNGPASYSQPDGAPHHGALRHLRFRTVVGGGAVPTALLTFHSCGVCETRGWKPGVNQNHRIRAVFMTRDSSQLCSPKNSRGTLEEHRGGTPEELQRNSRGTPEELQRNSRGTPEELQRNSRGTPEELHCVYSASFSVSLLSDAGHKVAGRHVLLRNPPLDLLGYSEPPLSVPALCVATGGSEVFYKRTGEEVTMDCPNVGLDSKRDVEWRHSGVRVIKINTRTGNVARGNAALASRARADGINMKIVGVQIGDFGDYSCSGFDTRGNRTTWEHKLNVVSVSVSPSDTVLVYTNVTLRCDVPGDPAAQVQWMKPPGDEAYGSPSNTVTLTSVTSAEAGQWVCLIRNTTEKEVGRFGVDIKVVGLITSSKSVVVYEGRTAELPCFLPKLNGLLIVGGGWMRDPPADLRLPTLSRNASGLHWNGNEIPARVTFMTPPLNTDFKVRLNKNPHRTPTGPPQSSYDVGGGSFTVSSVSVCGAGVSGPAGSILWAASCGQRPVGSVLWAAYCGAASCGQLPLGSVLWAASRGQRPVGQRPVGQCPVGQRPMGQRPVGQRLVGRVLWGSVLWAASFGQRPVGSVPWAASCGAASYGAASCGAASCGAASYGAAWSSKVERADAGVYVCTVKFEGGKSLKTYLELKVEEKKEEEKEEKKEKKKVPVSDPMKPWTPVVNKALCGLVVVPYWCGLMAWVGSTGPPKPITDRCTHHRCPPGPEVRFWEKRVLGVAVWVWLIIAAAVAYAILIYVIVARVVKHCRRKHRTADMSSSETLLWISLALCVATGGSEEFYKRTGEEVTMDCPNVDKKTTRDVEWRHSGVLVTKINTKSGNVARGSAALASRVRADGMSMRIPAVQMGDSGDYSCSGFDAWGYRITRDHKLNIVSVSASPSDTVPIGTSVTLTCDVSGDSQVEWLEVSGGTHNKKTITRTSVSSAEQWNCLIKDKLGKEMKRIGVNITVVGPLTATDEVTVNEGANAQLPCNLENPGKLQITGGGWRREGPSTVQLASLARETSSLQWINAARFDTQKNGQPTINFTVTLKKVKTDDAGVYVCSLNFLYGNSLEARLSLKVVGNSAATASGAGGSGGKLWIWISAGAGCVLLLVLAVIIVLIHRRNKHMRRRVRKLRSMRQPLTNRSYCQCARPARPSHPEGRGERPPPLPRYQYDEL
ncbi:hypothetical protein NFI96_031574 [Prochilodus magdalenae]|nr:hypothetical protein NFI96_031574 [Prochilodus magdalenae]